MVLAKTVDGLNGLMVGFHRLWLGAAVTVIVLLVAGGRVTGRSLRLSLWGGLFFGADIILFFSALQLTTVANATIIGALQPVILVFVGGRVFGERADGAIVGLTAVGVLGTALVILGSAQSPSDDWSLAGDLCALGALFSWSGYFATSKRAREELGTLEYLASFLLISTAAVAPIAVVFGGPVAPDGAGWAAIAVLAVVSGSVGHFFMNWAHPHIPLYLTSLLTLSIPIVAAGSAALFLDEPILLPQVIGMAIVLVAIGVVVLRTERDTAILA